VAIESALIPSPSGSWRSYALSPPFTVQSGDIAGVDGDTVYIQRGSVRVKEWTISGPGTPIGATAFAGPELVNKLVLFREKKMPGQNVACTKVVENQTTGAVTFTFSSGNNNEYADWDAVSAVADSLDADPTFAEKLLVAKAFRSSPDGANKTTQVGASVSINALADVPVVYTGAE
jgi:hypothetical protein